MKNFKILIIPFFIFAIFLIIGFIIYQNKAIISEYLSNEPVVENKISLKAKEIHDYMRENNYGYCTYDNRCNHEGSCGLNATFELSKNNYHNTCCATYVSWVLQETGYLTKQEHIDNYLNGANNLINYLTKKGWKEIDKKDIKPGDILCYNGHIAIYGGRGKQYDAGNKNMLETEAPCRLSWGMNTKKVLRAPDL
ncbi:MAG: hypothetical protein IJ890_07680 [Clostridia bacterium]|nr:hypothetical protein [Clostridia bacterium]